MTSAHFANAPFFAFIEIEKRQIRRLYIKTNEAAKLARKKGINAANFLVVEKVDLILVEDLGEGPFHFLNDSFVELYSLQEPVNVKEALTLLNNNKLARMTEPSERNEKTGVGRRS